MEATETAMSELNQGWSRIERDYICLETHLAKLEVQLEG